jgi:aspartyl-tRNA(Asn)/glutamyl-tRNA(Gln) amidotransferase subunit A
MNNHHKLTIAEVKDKIKRQELSTEEYVASILDRISKTEDKVNAFITVINEEALNKARMIDRKVRKGEKLGRLLGATVAIKDNICTKGIRTTCSSNMLKKFVPPYNATVIEAINNEDAIIIGKTNMDEFAMGTTTENSYFGPTKNPWNLKKVVGGSSGGSAAAVISDESTTALGSDTGGSIRCPASFCSTVGIKPTYGLVSRYGLISYADSLEQIGLFSKSILDCALLLSVISGHDPKDSTSVDIPKIDYLSSLNNEVTGIKIGVPKEFFSEGVQDRVKKNVWNAIYELEKLGATYKEVHLPNMRYSLASYYVIAMSEASSNLARYDGIRYGIQHEKDGRNWSTIYANTRKAGFGVEVKRRIILGTYALSSGYYDQYYLKALKIRTLIQRDFKKALKKFDVLVGPTMPLIPFDLGEKIDDPLTLYMCDILTVPANLTGYPAISIPSGFKNELPIGLQIIGKPFNEKTILQVAYTFEQNTDHFNQKPLL